jgi:hypothetical protein
LTVVSDAHHLELRLFELAVGVLAQSAQQSLLLLLLVLRLLLCRRHLLYLWTLLSLDSLNLDVASFILQVHLCDFYFNQHLLSSATAILYFYSR